jgi:type IV pilus assembly protein PilE
MKHHCKHRHGFTLIELLIAMIIIVILILMTHPTYQSVILKIRRAEARAALHSVMLQQERFYTQHNTYSAFTSDTKNALFKWWSGDTAATSYYEISATPCPLKQLNQCVLLTAITGTKNVKQVDDPVCGNLMLDSVNNKTYSKGSKPNSLCW